jgi:uncharacterized membrane protein
MVRKKIFPHYTHKKFRNLNNELFRIEALSDAVFAFSVSLLVASLEVPQTFHELSIIIKGAIPFFATVTLVFLFWYQQYKFFRHYALNDRKIILLNLTYLAVILFYVYPLKFLFSILLSSWTGIDLFPKATEKGLEVLAQSEFPQLIIIFSAGYFFIWILLYFMYKRALHEAENLHLNSYEIEYTKKEKRGAIWNSLIGIIAIIFALAGMEWLAGLCFLLIPLLLILNNSLFNIKLRKQK